MSIQRRVCFCYVMYNFINSPISRIWRKFVRCRRFCIWCRGTGWKKNENWGRGFFTWCYTSDKYIWYETPCEIHAFQITWHYFDVTMQKKFRHNVKTLQKPFPASLLQALDRWSLQTMNYCINNFKLLFQFNICDIKLKCVL